MRIAMIAAMTNNRVIGLDNDMPWHLPDDLKFFKAKTTGKPVVMGRKTFESIGCRPLPNRDNFVITRQTGFNGNGAYVVTSVEQVVEQVGSVDELIIMGGGQLYKQMLPQADRLYLTLIDAEIDGDTLFPDWQVYNWQEVERIHHAQDERHRFAFDFVTLDRIND